MRTSAFDSLVTINAAGVGELTLRRVWARARDHLALEYADANDRPVAAQWFSDTGKLARAGALLEAAAGRSGIPVEAGVGAVLVHDGGIDASLPGLHAIVKRHGAELISHYPDRRAVVRSTVPGAARYIKAVRPERLARAVRAHAYVVGVARGRFVVPELLDHDPDSGRFVLAAIPGESLHSIHDGPRLPRLYQVAGQALRSLHEAPIPGWAKPHTPADDVASLRERLELAGEFAPAIAERASAIGDDVLASLASVAGRRALLHRDFHEKQVIVGPDGRLGLLDFDTLAVGDPALDAANMLAHIELAQLQGRLSSRTANQSASAFLAGYGVELADLLPYLDATRLRLALLFALRPRWAWSAPGVLDRIGLPAPGDGSPRSRRNTPSHPRVFVVGCPRSGTTLLERMLDAHPSLAMAHETNWITRMCKGPDGLDPESPLRPDDLDRLEADRRYARMGLPREAVASCIGAPYRRFVEHVYGEFARRRGKAFSGDKSTGGYLRNLPLLGEVCPSSRILHLVRDGRDVCLSMLTWPKAAHAAGRFEMWSLDPVATTAAWWRWHVLHGVNEGRRLGASVYREFTYESLVAEPSRACAEICAFLGLEFDEAMLRFSDGRASSEPGLSANAAWLPPTPGLRDWRTQMSPEHAELFEAIAGDALDAFGYERRSLRPSPAIAAIAADRKQRWTRELSRGVNDPRPSTVREITT